MNPLTNMKNVVKLSEQELYNNSSSSWHDQYKDSAWIFVGGLPYDLSEGDIICIFSQYGEIVNINLVRDKDTGKSKGFCFICYEDQRSTVLAVDNFNGIKVLMRTIRVDHVSNYKVPKEGKKTDEETKKLYKEGCGPQLQLIEPKIKTEPEYMRETLADQIEADIKLPPRLPIYPIKQEPKNDDEQENDDNNEKVKLKKQKKKKKDKKKKKKKSKQRSSSSGSSDESDSNSSKSKSRNKDKKDILESSTSGKTMYFRKSEKSAHRERHRSRSRENRHRHRSRSNSSERHDSRKGKSWKSR